MESRHLAVLNVSLLMVTSSYSGSRAGRWTDRHKDSVVILLRLHHSRDLVSSWSLAVTVGVVLEDGQTGIKTVWSFY